MKNAGNNRLNDWVRNVKRYAVIDIVTIRQKSYYDIDGRGIGHPLINYGKVLSLNGAKIS